MGTTEHQQTPEARLREIVLRHTVVGGYPDTMAIAREAYALGAMASSPGEPAMHMERTVWHGASRDEERVELDAWIAEADHQVLERLIRDDLRVTDADHQQLLADVWGDAMLASGRQPDMQDMADSVTYHWGEGERVALRRAVVRLRPEHVEPDPTQGVLL